MELHIDFIKGGDMLETKLTKLVEAALVVAAQDGLDHDELKASTYAIEAVPRLGSAMQQHFLDNDMEIDELDFEDYDAMFAAISTALTESLDKFELIEFNEAYVEEVSSVFGNSPVLDNLCLGLAIACCAADLEVSDIEQSALGLLINGLEHASFEIGKTVAEHILEAGAAFQEE